MSEARLIGRAQEETLSTASLGRKALLKRKSASTHPSSWLALLPVLGSIVFTALSAQHATLDRSCNVTIVLVRPTTKEKQ
jgi:hypothetical protein